MTLIKKKYTFYVSITSLLLSTVVILSSLYLYISHRESKTAAIKTADQIFTEINTKTLERYENALQSIALVAGLGAKVTGVEPVVNAATISRTDLGFMFEAMEQHEYIYSTYIGHDDGSFIQLIAIRQSEQLLNAFNAPPNTEFALRTIAEDGPGSFTHKWFFLDRNRKTIAEIGNIDSAYDPRNRIWFQRAFEMTTPFFTRPYIFSSNKVPGITCARKLTVGSGVFGVDITLEKFSLSLQKQQISENGLLFLFDRSGRIIANPQEDPVQLVGGKRLNFLHGSDSNLAMVREVINGYQQGKTVTHNLTHEIEIDGKWYLMMLTGMDSQLHFDQILASIAPVRDFTDHIRKMRERIVLLCCAMLVLIIPITLLISRRISESLTRLELEALKIRERDFSDSEQFDSNIKEIHTLIQAFHLMKSTIRLLLEKQRKMFDDFTKLIAGAIDAKSPYTGGHCARVPVVAQMLADAACKTTTGPFSEFTMKNEDERWEFEVAAWLHDCGKVTTPEFIVDKATKLETIYDRIHEIRMRFELLLRDTEIVYYQKLLAGEGAEVVLQAEMESEKRRIKDDFEFIGRCNIGGEFMTDQQIVRLRAIADKTWLRHLDDRVGIGEDEKKLRAASPPQKLPVSEKLLADKPYHIISRENPTSQYQSFTMDIPENQYNLGELYNLSIAKGTLTLEDRFKIQEHIIQTINMLNTVEFPDYLERVPEYAGAHHETMEGTGYPRGLKKEQMSIPARIMAIADIFEALTAADRPYKKAKKLSATLEIMTSMCQQKHIDDDLFRLFIESGVYLQYAKKYLLPDQLDDIVEENFLTRIDKHQ